MDEIRELAMNCRIRQQDRQLWRWQAVCVLLASALAGSWVPVLWALWGPR